jgi:putative transposase
MSYVLRSSLPDGFFHVTARGVFGGRLFVDDSDRRGFIHLLALCAKTFDWNCHAYCLMSTHYHLVLSARQGDLSAGVQRLHSCHARGFNRRHLRYGALFAERFSARVIETEEYLYDACAYVLLNPVKAGLCTRADEWPWSYSSFGLELLP